MHHKAIVDLLLSHNAIDEGEEEEYIDTNKYRDDNIIYRNFLLENQDREKKRRRFVIIKENGEEETDYSDD